ncbi:MULTISPECIES: hypothetical protein [Streptomyces]|uniref:hypothetical protein n=1 Tax=Streptomyces TaxID=1883 RepID=UPI002248781F|nr:hypothetical protein [Streptomyces sp. JHD 1]MCX2967888.1 hypothetical protein [Streptomyces sp. JHD 1]
MRTGPSTGAARRAERAVAVATALVAAVAVVALGAHLLGPHGGFGGDAGEPRMRQALPVTAEAEEALHRLERAGLPVEHVRTVTPRSDPDRLLGHADGYRSKLSFEDRRVNGGLVLGNDPGSVALGGVIEVFADAASARRRAHQLQRDALGVPSRAERGYLAGRVLLRLSPYLAEPQAAEYSRALKAAPVPGAVPTPLVREA